jgi:hypothetical protein
MKIYLLIILTLLLSLTAFAQKFEAGSPAELKGLKRLYVRTLTDIKSRDTFTKEIKKAKLAALEIVDDERAAQIILIYEGGKFNASGAPRKRSADKGLVVVESKNADTGRILLTFENAKNSRSADKSPKEFAKAFIKAYKAANEIK